MSGAPDVATTREAQFVFALGGCWLALPAARVQRVLEAQLPTPLPLVPPHVRGLVRHGQQALVILDLAQFLGLTAPAAAADAMPPRVLVVRGAGLEVGMLVDRAAGVVEIEAAALSPPTLLSGGRLREFLRAETETSQGIVGLLELDPLLEAARV